MSDLAAAQTILQDRFGFADFKPGQREVLAHLLAGRSAAAVFPTGGGKSLCYQIPALILPGLTLVVSPLIALMKDQIDALQKRGIAARRLDSTLGLDEYREVMRAVRSGQLRLLYVAPERFQNERFCETIRQTRISLFAVDEAHCISEWGHNFRPDYLRLANFARLCRAERVLALTATATEPVLADICRNFQIGETAAVRTGFYRPNLTLLTTPIAAKARNGELLERLRTREPGPTIIYVTLQRTAEKLAQRLAAAGFSAQAYHAGMEDDNRARIQDWFLAGQREIVVATIAFGMGIDKANIRYVYHYNPPKSLENYAQEIGRAGRDGIPAVCELLFCRDDLNTLENFVYGDTPTFDAVAGIVEELLQRPGDFDVSIYELSNKFDIRLAVVRTLLTYLELAGQIAGGTPYYSSYEIKPLLPSAQILAKFEGERKTFLANLFRQFQRQKIWLRIDVDQAAQKLGEPRERIVRALDYMAEQQFVELKTAGTRQRYSLASRPESVAALTKSLFERLEQRESRELARLRDVVAWVHRDGCQTRALGEHFAESGAKDCGHCSWCLSGGKPAAQIAGPETTIDETLWKQAAAVRQAQLRELGPARAFARFLCGVSSPWLTRAKLQNSPLFGSLTEVPFPVVLERLAGK